MESIAVMHCGNPYRNKEQSVDGDIMTSIPPTTRRFMRELVFCVCVCCACHDILSLTHHLAGRHRPHASLILCLASNSVVARRLCFPKKNSCSSTAAYNVITAICKELFSLYFVWRNINVEVDGVGCRVIRGARGDNKQKLQNINIFV